MSYHGNLLKQYLVCRHYSFNDLDLGSSDLKGYVKAVCETLSISTIPFNVLAVIPINILIEGKPTTCCKLGNFREGFIFAKLCRCEVSGK